MVTRNIRLVRSAPDPLGLYLRVGHNGQKEMQSFIASGDAAFSGVVFDARRVAKHKELLSQVLERRIDAVLDPLTQAMGTVGGYADSMGSLPWCAKRAHTPADFATEFARHKFADEIAQFAVSNGFTQILAPTHLISGPDDPWLDIDIATAKALRIALQRRDAENIQVNYSLAISYAAFRTPLKRHAVLSRLHEVKMDSLWLHVDGCGSDSSSSAVTRYGDAAIDFHQLGVPIVADHMGGLVGLSLLAFGAVGVQTPSRHFLYQRTREVAGLSQIPESLRSQQFLEEHLRPVSDRAVLAATQLQLH